MDADPKTLELDKDAPRRSMERLVVHLREKMLDRPMTVALLADKAGCSQSKVRKWLDGFGSKLAVGYTRPRQYWLPEQEAIRERILGVSETRTICSRNRM